MRPDDANLTIREFLPGDEIAFRQLNEEWILRYFTMESKDVEALADPCRTILAPGGRIFIALRGTQPIGCCALLAIRPGEYEVAKMAVTASSQGGGIGRGLLQKVIAEARAAGATRLYLETNHVLTPAIRLYESLGFRHIPRACAAPSPYARSDVSMELHLVP